MKTKQTLNVAEMEALDNIIENFTAKAKGLRTAQAHYLNGDDEKGGEALKAVGFASFFGVGE